MLLTLNGITFVLVFCNLLSEKNVMRKFRIDMQDIPLPGMKVVRTEFFGISRDGDVPLFTSSTGVPITNLLSVTVYFNNGQTSKLSLSWHEGLGDVDLFMSSPSLSEMLSDKPCEKFFIDNPQPSFGYNIILE